MRPRGVLIKLHAPFRWVVVGRRWGWGSRGGATVGVVAVVDGSDEVMVWWWFRLAAGPRDDDGYDVGDEGGVIVVVAGVEVVGGREPAGSAPDF
ncbi:hypothetical protein Tco_0773672 [Tanacetum coccineum]|uniref:Uncharacterized protein n=1 Tax=Tanacetum coccineum TaxID=301880 RepID=A0ABQ4ZNY1_9ASTR